MASSTSSEPDHRNLVSQHSAQTQSSSTSGTNSSVNTTSSSLSSRQPAAQSSLPPGQPAIRMTDSASGPHAPSSLKFAALSVDSYHLDSPPFTGVPIGSGPADQDKLDQAGRQLAEQGAGSSQKGSNTTSPLARAQYGAADADSMAAQHSRQGSKSRQSNGHALRDFPSPSTPTASSSQSSADRPSGALDRDVPNWELDGRRRMSSASSTQLQRDASTSTAPSSVSSLPPGHSLGRSTSAGYSEGRPLLTQLTDDVDGLNHQHEPDQEVDGDGHGYVLGNPSGASSSEADVVPVQSQLKADYSFPRHRLPLQMRDESKIPLVIVACGSFSPPTYLHLRIFEMAKDQVIESGKYELLAGYYSPVSDHYRKAGLAQAKHRVRMCELAVEKTSTWLMVDAWESLQDEYQRTAVVLDHFEHEINGPLAPSAGSASANGSRVTSPAASTSASTSAQPRHPERGVLMSDGRRRRVKIMLLAGGDLIQSMGEPGVWADADLHHILGRYGCMIVERTGADVWSFLLSHDLLWRYRRNLRVVKQTIYNDISSSKVRLFVRRGQSIKYLLPNSVIKYIETHELYRLDVKAQQLQLYREEDGEPYLAPEDEQW